MDALNTAIALAGSAAKFAEIIGVSQSAPHMWLARKSVPAEHFPAIERATEGAVTCEQLAGEGGAAWARIKDAAWPWHPKGRPVLDVTRAVA